MNLIAQDACELDLDQMGDNCDAKKEGICMKDKCETHDSKEVARSKMLEEKREHIMSMTPPSRFDYVKYDGTAQATQDQFKKRVQELELLVNTYIPETAGEYKKDALKALELFYMLVGKGVRDDQIKRNGFYELQEERTNS